MCLNPTLDKQGGAKVKQSARTKQLLETAENNDLVHIWRILNEDRKRFTWQQLH